MENIISNGRSAAWLGFLSAMPLALILLIEISGIEPLHVFFVGLTTESGSNPRMNTFGMILIFGAMLLLPIGLAVSLAPVVRNARAGFGFRTAANPFNLLIAAALFIFIATLVTGFVIDQYPCWIGVPNCD